MKAQFHEGPSRSLIKAITYRFLIIVSNGVIIFLMTHQYDLTLSVMLFSSLISTLLYFIHERIWNHIHWGKAKKKIS